MEIDEAIGLTLQALKNGSAGHYGYDLYPFKVSRDVAWQRARGDHQAANSVHLGWSGVFLDAAWQLCQRGLIRPGVRGDNQQPDQQYGGYSLTSHGAKELAAFNLTDTVLLQPGSLAATFTDYRTRFGEGFHQRSQEAIRCRSASAWLACCAMAGAAAESILLAIAIAKKGGVETEVLAAYRSGGGTQKVINIVTGQASQPVQQTMRTFTGIISNWRNESAHGQASSLSTANADEALRQLLHLCQWVEREWAVLTAP